MSPQRHGCSIDAVCRRAPAPIGAVPAEPDGAGGAREGDGTPATGLPQAAGTRRDASGAKFQVCL
jgi:hypothetical protein